MTTKKITYAYGVDTSTTTRTASVTTPVQIASTGADTLVLNISEDAYLGDAEFTIMVNGVQYGGVLTATALKSQNASQNFTILGNFPPGPLNVSVNFLNDAVAVYSDGTVAGDRNLYVNAISVNGVATTENGYQNLSGARSYALTAPALAASTPVLPTISVSTQTLRADTGASSTDLITSNGAVTLTGQVTGASGTTVEIFNGTTALGQAKISNGVWSFSTTLAAGADALHAVATDPSGNVATSAVQPTINVETAAPVITIAAGVQTAGTDIVTVSGKVSGAAGTTVEVYNGATALGAATVTNGVWSYQASLAAGSYSLSAKATDLAGNTASAADPALLVAPASTAGDRVFGVATSSTTRTASVTTPVTMSSGGSDVIVLSMAEDAYLGDAEFTVSVNGVQIGGVQTTTALHGLGTAQAFTLAGNFGTGSLAVSIDFLNEAYVENSAGVKIDERTLYVDAITINGKSSKLNAVQRFGAKSYNFTVPATVTSAAPSVSITAQTLARDTGARATDGITSDGAITLQGAVTGASGTVVQILNGTTVLGTAVSANGFWSFTDTLAAGSYSLHAVATDPAGITASSAAAAAVLVETASPSVTMATPSQLADSSAVTFTGTVTGAAGTTVNVRNGTTILGAATVSNGSWRFTTSLAAGSYDFSAVATDLAGNTTISDDPAFEVAGAAPSVAITAQTLPQDSGASATDRITSDGAVVLAGTVGGAAGTIVEILDGTTVLGDATIANGSWTYATTLASGSHTLHAVAVDPAGNKTSSAAEPTIVVDTTAPSLTIAAPVQTAGSTAFTLSGTVGGLTGTTVEIFNGGTAIGAAVVSNGGWSFSDNLGAGSFALTAKATDPAGNVSAASDAAVTIAAPASASGVMSTTAFLATLGVDTHMAYTDGEYADVSMIIADLKYLGISQVRDGITNGVDANGNANGSAPLSTYLAMAKAGIKFTFIIEATSAAVIATQLALINQVEAAVPGSVTAIEGPNEINNEPITFNGLTGEPAALAAQAALYAAVKADATLAGVPVDYFTGYGAGSDAAGPDPTTTLGLADFDTQHPYPNFGQPPGYWVARATALGNLSAADVATAPAVYTETGYSSAQVTPYVQEVYTLDLLMDTANDGISKTYLYDLVDAYAPGSVQGDDGYGLFDNATAAKPVATAIHNLTSILADTGATAASFATTRLGYSISGLGADGNSMVMETSNGTYELVIWAEPEIYDVATGTYTAAPAQNVTVSLAKTFGSIEVFDATIGTNAIASDANADSVTVSVTDHPIIIQLGAVATGVLPAAPSVTFGAETLASDTGASATDKVTSDGVVTLTGLVTGEAGTTVAIMNGATLIGNASIANGAWRYAGTLAAGSYSLTAVATDPAGRIATSAAEPTIVVDTTAPAVTIAAPTQSATSTVVSLAGTVANASGTSVEIFNGSAALGEATVANGAWTFATTLSAGSVANFRAVATDLAGNSSMVSDAAYTVTTPATVVSADPITASVSNGTSEIQTVVDLSSSTAISGTIVPVSTSGIGTNPLVVFNWDPASQLASLLASLKAGDGAVIAAEGDSTTLGFGAAASGFRQLSYPYELSQALTADGVASNTNDTMGQGNENGGTTDTRVSFFGDAAYVGAYDAGGQIVQMNAAGSGMIFTPSTPTAFNRVTVSYMDFGSGTVTISVDGAAVGTLTFGNTGNTMQQTLDIPLGTYGNVSITANDSNQTDIQGISLANSTENSIQVDDTAIGGWGSGSADTSVLNDNVLLGSADGFGMTAGTVALAPNLTMVDLGINDITGFANNGTPLTAAAIIANLTQIVATLKAGGSDVILVIPQPFSDPGYATLLPALRAGLETLSLAENVPLIDLSQTYNNNYAALLSAGLMADTLHPNATLYADIGTEIANVLANAIDGTTNGTAATSNGTSGNDTLSGTKTINTLIGNGGSDTYVINATDQADLVINGSSAGTAAAGQIEFAAANHNELWFAQSGNNLVVETLGTDQQVVIKNWQTSGSAKVAEIVGSDGYKIDAGLQSLVQAMASFSAANPGFNAAATGNTSLTDSAFGTLAAAVQADWHR
jgi:hypothetical protein